MYHNPFPWGWRPLAYCVLPYFCLVYCVPQCFGLAYCVLFNNKTFIFGNFIYIKKIKCILRARVQSFLQTSIFVCFCLLDFLVFDIPKSMFMLINAAMTPQKARAKWARENFKVFLTLFVAFAVVLDENWNF